MRAQTSTIGELTAADIHIQPADWRQASKRVRAQDAQHATRSTAAAAILAPGSASAPCPAPVPVPPLLLLLPLPPRMRDDERKDKDVLDYLAAENGEQHAAPCTVGAAAVLCATHARASELVLCLPAAPDAPPSPNHQRSSLPAHLLRSHARLPCRRLCVRAAYCAAAMADTEALQAALYEEMRARIQEADTSVATRCARIVRTHCLAGRPGCTHATR